MPKNTALERWYLTMRTMQTLTATLGGDMEYLNPLLQGIVTTAFHNPLLRMVMINGVPCIAHVTSMFKISIVGLDNPLENASSTGDLRARIYGNLGAIVIEKNAGPRYKDEVERSINTACTQAGNEMARTEDYLGSAGQTFSTLLPMTMSHCGSAFEWTKEKQHNLSTFKRVEIIEKADGYAREIPTTFDLLVFS